MSCKLNKRILLNLKKKLINIQKLFVIVSRIPKSKFLFKFALKLKIIYLFIFRR